MSSGAGKSLSLSLSPFGSPQPLLELLVAHLVPWGPVEELLWVVPLRPPRRGRGGDFSDLLPVRHHGLRHLRPVHHLIPDPNPSPQGRVFPEKPPLELGLRRWYRRRGQNPDAQGSWYVVCGRRREAMLRCPGLVVVPVVGRGGGPHEASRRDFLFG